MYAGGKGDKQEPLKGQLLSLFFSFSYVVYIHGNITRLAGHTIFFGKSYMRFVDQCSFIGISGTFSF